MSRLGRDRQREHERAEGSPDPAVTPIDVCVPEAGSGAQTATIDGSTVVAGPGEEIQNAVLNRLHRLALAVGRPVLATIHDRRIGYSVPLRVDPDGSSHLAADPVPTAPEEEAPAGWDRPTHVLRPLEAVRDSAPTFPLPAVPDAERTPAGDSPPTFTLGVLPGASGGTAPGTVAPPTGEFGPPPRMEGDGGATGAVPPEAAGPFARAGYASGGVSGAVTAAGAASEAEVPVSGAPVTGAPVTGAPVSEPSEPAARPASGPRPFAGHEPVADPQPHADRQPLADAQPVAGVQPHADRQPLADAEPVAGVQPLADVQPRAGAQPVADAKPVATAKPLVDPGPFVDPDPKPTPARGFDAVAEAVLGDGPLTAPGDSTVPALLAQPTARINEAVKEGRTQDAALLAHEAVAEASQTLGPEHPEVLRLRELTAYIAYLSGDPDRAFRLSLDLARIHRRAGDAEAAYGNVQSAATAWRAVRDPERGMELGQDLVGLWDELAAEEGPAAEDAEQLESARTRMGRLADRARAQAG
ncbi:tetratricopeptide repeat protein [Streptomyces sp. NPDC049936]|uniref:tetratricopeptide repeat protein n=1 Tax=Streptomyces sp. NPDC049936 TaxID=3365599 RepID=UPI00378FB10B